ncbi:hypothetical protein MN608_10635 [Microdochium nivale]|nr:hypothetical protein MN608_10635 [Microdochium nivale]
MSTIGSADEHSSDDDGSVCWTPQSDTPASPNWPPLASSHEDDDFNQDLSLSFDSLSNSILPVGSGAQAHEVILVHGFSLLGNSSNGSSRPSHHHNHRDRASNDRAVGSDEHPQYFQARHVLEEWARTSCAETQQQQQKKKKNQPVNLRCMAFSTAEVLQHGKVALCAAAHFLCNSLMQMTLDETSSLFLGGGVGGGSGDRIGGKEGGGENSGQGRHFHSASAGGTLPVFRPRRVTFVAHGLGIWVVKQALLWFAHHGTPLRPAATFFFDGARISRPDLASGYLHDTAAVFALQWPAGLTGARLEGVRQHLVVVDRDFEALMADAHGECCEIRPGDEDLFRYEMVRYNHQLWHFPSPPLRFVDTEAAMSSLWGGDLLDPVAAQVRRLAFLELGRNLDEAVSLRLLKSSQQKGSDAHVTTSVLAGASSGSDADGGVATGADHDDASVASSGSRYSSGNNGPPSTPRGEMRHLQMEGQLEDSVPNSPRGSEWSELVDAGGPDNNKDEDESLRYHTSNENVAHYSIPGQRETFDMLHMERYLGSRSTARNKSVGGCHIPVDASRSLEESTASSGRPCEAVESSTLENPEGSESICHSIYETERGSGHAAYNGSIPRSRPYRDGALGLAKVSSRSETTVLHDGRQEELSQTQPQSRWRPRGPLGFATRSSRPDTEHRVSRGTSGRDSTSVVSSLTLHGDGDNPLDIDQPKTTTTRNREYDVPLSVSSLNVTKLSQRLDQDANLSRGSRTQSNSIMKALHELESSTATSPGGSSGAVDGLVSQLAESVHAELPVLDARWPNIRRSLRWLMRDVELARYEASRPAVRGRHDAGRLLVEGRSEDGLLSCVDGAVGEEQVDEYAWRKAHSTEVEDLAERYVDEEDYS